MFQLLEIPLCREDQSSGRDGYAGGGRGVAESHGTHPFRLHSETDGAGRTCGSHHWLPFGVKTFKAVIKINVNDSCEE